MHRKSLIRLLKDDLQRYPRRHQRSPTYGPEVDEALTVIAEALWLTEDVFRLQNECEMEAATLP